MSREDYINYLLSLGMTEEQILKSELEDEKIMNENEINFDRYEKYDNN